MKVQVQVRDIIIYQVGLEPRRLAWALVKSGLIDQEKQAFPEKRREEL